MKAGGLMGAAAGGVGGVGVGGGVGTGVGAGVGGVGPTPTSKKGTSVFRQGSGESNFSQRSSDLSLDEEREHFRRDTERQALVQLEKARSKPVAFAVKTNVAFDGSLDDDSPVHGSAVSFSIGDYLHVMER